MTGCRTQLEESKNETQTVQQNDRLKTETEDRPALEEKNSTGKDKGRKKKEY